MVAVLAFWFFALLAASTWILYPLGLVLARLLRRKNTRQPAAKADGDFFSVSFIIAACNEEEHIASRIENLLALDYPRHKIQIIIASDGSSDRTDDIVSSFSAGHSNVKLLSFDVQRGRAAVHNEAVGEAGGEIIVFTDARTRFDREFLKNILPHFYDPEVGAVCGRLYYENVRESSIAESAGMYWKYEDFIRCLESDMGILSFGSGAALAVRKKLYEPIGLEEDVDRVLTLDAKIKGFIVRYEPRAKAYDYIEAAQSAAHAARVRKTTRAFGDVLVRLRRVNPLRNPVLFMSIFFHKTSRHLMPLYMLGLFIFNLILINNGIIYLVLFALQLVFYALALGGWFLEKKRKKVAVFYIPYSFTLLNIGRLSGITKRLRGRKVTSYHR
jgi:cellulose synthase/poly-beta-1,6-N-acetylglucosamine synthase-like glycosyltransferase